MSSTGSSFFSFHTRFYIHARAHFEIYSELVIYFNYGRGQPNQI